MNIDDIKLPMNLSLTDLVRMSFIKWLQHNDMTTEQTSDGKFHNDKIQARWIACRVGANCVVNVMEERITNASNQVALMKARIKELEAQLEQKTIE